MKAGSLEVQDLSASLPVFTDANKKLASKSVADTLAALGITTVNPIGAVTMWPTETVPTGWLECNGASLERTGTYAGLFAVLGTLYGTADASHFNLPDYRGRIPRAWDHGKTLDPDRATRTVPGTTGATLTAGDHVGTEQVDGLKAHTHGIEITFGGAGGDRYIDYPTGPDNGVQVTTSTGGNETRPVNTNLMFIIRYQ